MAMPNCATSATTSLESRLRENLVRIWEAEQRSKLRMMLLRMGLLTKDVKNVMGKQLKQQRSLGPKGGGVKLFKSGKNRMMEKLSDSRKDEAKLRKVRDSLRIELEEISSGPL